MHCYEAVAALSCTFLLFPERVVADVHALASRKSLNFLVETA